MGITRKFIFLLAILTLIAIPVSFKINAKRPLAIFNGEKILVIDNGFAFEIKAYGNTVSEILENSKIIVNEKDIVFPRSKLEKNQKIIIFRSTPVILNIKGNKKKIFTLRKTVGEVLKEENLKISNTGLLNYNLSEEVFPGMEIIILTKPNILSKSSLKLAPRKAPKKSSLQKTPVSIQKTSEGQTGSASWYNYIPGNYCASLRFPWGARLLVTNIYNGRSVVVTVNDRGPFNGRIIDLERNAFSQIASTVSGTATVRVQRIK